MSQINSIHYKLNGRWHKYEGKIPDEVEAIEVNETMTMEEYQKTRLSSKEESL